MLIIFIFKKKNRKTQKLLVYVQQDILVCGCNQSKDYLMNINFLIMNS
jgi:hypothetical protein